LSDSDDEIIFLDESQPGHSAAAESDEGTPAWLLTSMMTTIDKITRQPAYIPGQDALPGFDADD
jgi:hypothetical protein